VACLVDNYVELCYTGSTLLNSFMNDPKPNKLTDAVKEALAKKHEATRPDVKTKKTKVKQNYGAPMIKGAPVRKASGRGG
jgi:hypothetical protein